MAGAAVKKSCSPLQLLIYPAELSLVVKGMCYAVIHEKGTWLKPACAVKKLQNALQAKLNYLP